MPRTVSATIAKNRLGALIDWVVRSKDEIIVESRGEPKVVLISFAGYEQIRRIKEQVRRREALAKLEELRQKVNVRNEDLSEQEAEVLADRFVRDVIDDMVKEGRIRYSS